MSSASTAFVAPPSYYYKNLGQNVDLASLNSTMDFFASQSETVTILKSQYENLLRVARQFDNLRESLLRGGVSLEDLDVLVNDAVAPRAVDEKPVQKSYGQNHQSPNGASPSTRRISSEAASTSFRPSYKTHIHKYKHDVFSFEDSIEGGFNNNEEEDEELDEAEDQEPQTGELQRQQNPSTDGFDDDDEPQTIEIRNLPERCTHLDITKSIRGGALVQIYMRFAERAARVTFVDAAAAREFLARGKRIGFSIRDKKVDLSWSDRQFTILPYIKQSITHNGATRNLMIRNTNSNITPALIREHLEHIHNLIVVNIKIDQMSRSIVIYTNSVHNAMFARSCMRSRAAYKGMKIGFGIDECAAPWSSSSAVSESMLSATAPEYQGQSNLARAKGRREMQQQQKQSSAVSNRFDLLSLDSGSTDSDVDEESSNDPDS